MANYRESIVNGARWWRARLVSVANEIGKAPTISFAEEEVMQMQGSDEIIKLASTDIGRSLLTEEFRTPDEEFILLDPDTDEPLGKATYGDLRTILYSMYRHVAEKRDTAPPIPVTPVYQAPPEMEEEEESAPLPPEAP